MTSTISPGAPVATRRKRRTALLLAVSMLISLVGASIANAAPIEIANATFEWGLSAEMQSAPPFGGCNYLSAGASQGDEATYATSSGAVSIVKDGVAPTWANKCDGATTGTMNQKVIWSGGVGSVDPATGTATIAFTGQLSVNFYGGLVPFFIEDPVLTVDSAGNGQIVGTLGGFASSPDNPFVKEPIDSVSGIVIADLGEVDSDNEVGFVTTPKYEGVVLEAPEGFTPQNRTTEGWGSWPLSFVDFHFDTGLSSYWYHSGGGADPKKVPSAITVSYGDTGGEPGGTVPVENLAFEWGFNNTIQHAWSGAVADGGPDVACHFLSAGQSDGYEATYQTEVGNVTILKPNAEGVSEQPTFATRCLRDDQLRIGQKVVWSGGTGTLDPETGAMEVAFTGTLSINFNNFRSPIWIVDPVLSVGADGTAQLIATVGGYRGSQGGGERVLLDPVAGVVVADFTGADGRAIEGLTLTPEFFGVEVTVVNNFPEQPPTTISVPTAAVQDGKGVDANGVPLWGSLPESFVDFGYRTGLNSYFHSSNAAPGNAGDLNKAPLPVSFYTLEGEDPEPGDGEQVITVVVPESSDPGEFVWTIVGNPNVTMTEAVNLGTFLHSTGSIAEILVSDTRPGGLSWSLTGQVSDFSGGVPGSYLGWNPFVIEPGAGAVAGAEVISGFISGDGLSVTSILAASAGGHAAGTARVGADLDLRLPVDTPPGTYRATLTITGVS